MTTDTNSDTSQAVRTFHHEAGLPRVPLPTLEDSCARFLDWCAPLLTPGQLAETRAAVTAALEPDSDARALHAELARFDAEEGVASWLDVFWPYRYLGRRDRIALNANFFFLFSEDNRLFADTGALADTGSSSDTGRDQVTRAANLIAAALDFKLALDEERIPPVLARGVPNSMDQNKFLFSTTRIPGETQDTVRSPYSAEHPGPSTARHIAVLIRGAIFRLDVLGADGRPHSTADLAEALTALLATAPERGQDIGHLTTKARAEWAASRAALLQLDPSNAEALDVIESALFCLCLEDLSPDGVQRACDELLHGNSGNRWFDKSVSLIVFADGRAGINVEHCGLDGTTILGFVDALLDTPVAEHEAASGAVTRGAPDFVPVEFTLDDALRADIAAAGTAFAEYAAATATEIVSFSDFGSNDAKALKVSPDAFVQMAYQLAHQRAKGMIGATYESIATRQYRNGRTEAMRVVTPEVLTFVAAMDDPAATTADRLAAFRAAADRHVARARECQAGQAPEQHLWELQLIQRRRGAEPGITEPLALCETPGWRIMRDDYLSTSSAPSRNIQYFGFGSTSSQCIGVAYVLLPDRFHVYLSTPRPVAEQMHTFARRLRDAVGELRTLLS